MSHGEQVTVHVEGHGEAVASVGETILDVCERADFPMEMDCGGFASCNSCRVRVVSGSLTPSDAFEEPFLDEPGHRLGCQARVLSDIRVVLDPGN
jgi:ferredoxin